MGIALALISDVLEISPVLTLPNGGPVLKLPDGPYWVDLAAGDRHVIFPPRYRRQINLRVASLATDDPLWREPVEAALNQVINLPEDWDSYGGHPVSIDVAMAAVQLLATLSSAIPAAPTIAPLPSGGITLSWRIANRVIDIDVEATRFDVYVEEDGVTILDGDLRENMPAIQHQLAQASPST